MRCCHSTGRACWGVGTILSAWVFFLMGIFVPGVIENLIHDGVTDMVLPTEKAKRENQMGWQQFVDNSLPASNPLYQRVMMWNLTNPHEVFAGTEKAKVVEIGPYVYRANQRRMNTTFWVDRMGRKQVKFKMYRWFTFEPTMSGPGLDPINDEITSANIMFQATYFQSPGLAYLIYSPKSQFDCMFATRKVHWWLWGGKSLDIPFMKYPGTTVNDTMDSVLKDDYTSMYTGEDNVFQAMMITSWKGHGTIVVSDQPPGVEGNMVPAWATPEANILHGTSGDSFPPLHSYGKGDSVPAWTDDLAMQLPLQNRNDETITVKGVELIQFRMTEEQLQNSKSNPLNKPYYMDGPNGFFNLTSVKVAPLFASMPHFLYVDKETQDMVEGCNPDEELHSTWLGVEPWTGMTLDAQKTWQVNVKLGPKVVIDPDGIEYNWFNKSKPGLYLPVCWMLYGGEMTDTVASTIKGQVYMGATALKAMPWIGFGFGTVNLILGLGLLLSAMKQLTRETRSKSRVVSSGSRPGYRRVSEG